MFISTVLALEQSGHALKAYLLPETPYLVDTNGNILRARPISDGSFAQGSNLLLALDAGIHTFALYTVQNDLAPHQGVAALAGDVLHFIQLLSAGLQVRYRLPLEIVHGHSRPPEMGPSVQAYRFGKAEFLALYVVSGFVTLVDLTRLFSQKRGPRPYRTFSIGSIVVVSLVIMQNSPTLALLYRDIDFNYLLRYYDVLRTDKFPVIAQMELFSGVPSHVTAAACGCFVHGDAKLWFFPAPGKSLLLSGSAAEDHTVSLNQKHNVVTKMGHASGKVTCSTQIDENRYLYITETGLTHMLYMLWYGNSLQVCVTSLQVLDLGKLTIATDVVHVQDNVFYAGLAISRSIVFQVRTSQPYIHVARTLTNSPPILDVALGLDAYKSGLWISRGGFYNGEVQLYTGTDLSMVPKAQITTSEASAVRFANADTVVLLNGDIVQAYCVDLGITATVSPEFSNPRLYGVSSDTEWEIGLSMLRLERAILSYDGMLVDTHMPEITGVDWYVQDNQLTVLAALWGGKITQVTFGELPGVQTADTGGVGHVSICRTPSDTIICVDGAGRIFQSAGFGGKSQINTAGFSEGSFKLAGGERVLVYSTFSVYLLEGTGVLHPHRVFHSRRRIVSCDLHGNKVAVLFLDKTLSMFELETAQIDDSAYLSERLILKSISVGKWLVSLQMDMDTRAPQMSLVVLEQSTLKKEWEEKVGGLVDICLLEASGPLIVGAVSNCRIDEALPVFKVEKGRIRKLRVPVNGLLPKTATISKISAHGNTVCVAGNCTMQYSLEELPQYCWNGKVVPDNGVPFFIVAAASLSQGTILADANRGLFLQKKDHPMQKFPVSKEPCYASAVAILEGLLVVIYGDSCGNLGVVGEEQILAANIKEQINTITVEKEEPLSFLVGTAQGSVYRVQEGEDNMEHLWRDIHGKENTDA